MTKNLVQAIIWNSSSITVDDASPKSLYTHGYNLLILISIKISTQSNILCSQLHMPSSPRPLPSTSCGILDRQMP